MNSRKLLRSITLALAGTCVGIAQGQNKLQGKAVAAAGTFTAGPISGKYIGVGPIAGQPVPFSGQPFQGISALIDNHDGTFMAMPDNGYGSIETSADFYLRVYRIRPNFKTVAGGAGSIEILSHLELNDADKKIPFAIVNDFTQERKLTGADFDIESIQRAADSTYWIGDEFGPFLLHFDKTGKLLETPYQLPDFEHDGQFVRAPQNPYNEEASALRLMNAYRTHAQLNGNTKAPVFSPNFNLIDDLDTATVNGDRKNPVSGLAKASTDLFNVSLLKAGGYPVVAWTVNDSASIMKLLNLGVNGIISDYPELLMRLVSTYDKNKDGIADFMDAEGLLDISKFDAQAHRGGRGIRPENTLPSFENGLNALVTTLEMDCGITADGIPVISHDPHIQYTKAFKIDGTSYTLNNEVLIKDLTVAQLQSTFTLNKLLGGTWTSQQNDTTLSPVSVAYIQAKGIPNTYAIPTLEQVFDFVDFYVTYYTSGAGSTHPDAVKRAKNAARVRFNIETKFNPRTDNDPVGVPFISRTVAADTFAVKIAELIVREGLEQRADIQSFAFQTLLKVQQDFPTIRTVYLFTDSPKLPTNANDGGNLQPQGSDNKSPWLAGLYWPYRSTKLSNPFRAQRSGGFEGMALNVAQDKLWPLLELPLTGDDKKTIWLHEFDLASKTYTGKRFKFKYGQGGTNIGDFCMFNEKEGLIIERDNNQGPPSVVKRIYKVAFSDTDTLTKTLVVDLLDLQDSDLLSEGGNTLTGDYGVGANYKFPYQTIESVVVQDARTLVVINDNNYPFSVGRHVGNTSTTSDDITDDNEMIVIRLDQANALDLITSTDDAAMEGVQNTLGSYPNPFGDHATFEFTVAEAGSARLIVQNAVGVELENIALGNLSKGKHQYIWKASSSLAKGLYVVKLKTTSQEQSMKLVKE